MLFRSATVDDLPELVAVQEAAAVVALGHVFPQDRYPFPREAVLERWAEELDDPGIDAYVSTDAAGRITGFAARRADELLHFGTALSTWGTGLAVDLHDALLQTYPEELGRVWLRVFEDNHRARRFWARLGWVPTGERSRSDFVPHPVLLGYELRRPGTGASQSSES
jgi:RimJ/RimL family protein N-acetyltransferase